MRLDKDRIKAVIMADCDIRFAYQNVVGQTCAIGGLAKAAGVELPKPGDLNSMSNIANPGLRFLQKDLEVAYGLTLIELCDIQLLNDDYIETSDRRAAICGYIDSLED